MGPLSRLGINIYNLEDDDMEKPFASTTIDLFDSHRRMRQGTMNLQLYKGASADTSLQTTTPGLTTHTTTVDLNNLLILIRQWRKKSQVSPSWLDKLSF